MAHSGLDLYFGFVNQRSKKGNEMLNSQYVPLAVIQPCESCRLLGNPEECREMVLGMIESARNYVEEKECGICRNDASFEPRDEWMLGLERDSDEFAALQHLYDYCTSHCGNKNDAKDAGMTQAVSAASSTIS